MKSPRPDLSQILGKPVEWESDPRGNRHYFVEGKKVTQLPCPTNYKQLQEDEIALFTKMKEREK
jgi:hypothetical protein